MSASKNKKIRMEQDDIKSTRNEETKKSQQYKQKVRIITCVVVVLVVAILFLTSNLFYKNVATAARVNGKGISAAEFNYYYSSNYLMYSQYGLIDDTVSVKKQVYNEETGETWDDYLTESALSSLKEIKMLCAEAKTAGYKLSEEGEKSVEESISSLKANVLDGGYPSFAVYLSSAYGKGMTASLYKKLMKENQLASEYAVYVRDSFTFSDSELSDNYKENKNDYDIITYRSYYFEAELGEDEETPTAEAVESARQSAKTFADSITDEDSFTELVRENVDEELKASYDSPAATLYTSSGKDLSDIYKDWLLSSGRKSGDITTVENKSEDGTVNGVYVLYFVDRDSNDYASVNGSYVVFDPEQYAPSDEESEHDDAQLEAIAQQEAQELLEAWNSGAYATFEELYEANEDHASGHSEFEQLGRNDTAEELTDWLFDSSRKAGDVEIIYVESYGCYYLIKYDGVGDTYSKVLAKQDMSSKAYEEWEEKTMENYTATTTWGLWIAKKASPAKV